MTVRRRVVVVPALVTIVLAGGFGWFPAPLARPGAHAASEAGGPSGMTGQILHILTLREQAAVCNGWIRTRLESVVPELMREEGFDMWLVICRENVEDPVCFTLVPFTTLHASRTQMLVFFDRGAAGVERCSVNFRQMGDWWRSVWEPAVMGQLEALAAAIKARNPRVIGINESPEDNYGDGLTTSLEAQIVSALGPECAGRLKWAERLAARVLERRTPGELELYPQIMAVAHAIIAEAFSNQVITTGVTTTEAGAGEASLVPFPLSLTPYPPSRIPHPCPEETDEAPDP